jgi:hypothetical protein
MKAPSSRSCILAAACAGLLAAPVARGEGPGTAYDVRVDKGETLADYAWQHRRERAEPRMEFGILGVRPEVFPGGNLGEERADERGAFRAHRQPGGWYQPGRDQRVPAATPVIPSPLAP